MAAVPSIGRASRVERPAAPGADAATDLYERFSPQIFGYCFRQLGSREEAEDAVQTTFMNAFRGLARGVVPEAEEAWLFKIAHNVCLSRRRSSWRRGRVEAPNNMEVLQEVVPAKEKVTDELIRLEDVLGAMPDNQRRAILLREWQGLSYREIANELELSQAAVETLIFRARRALASGLEQTPARWRKRLRRGADVGGAVTFLKTLLGGGGAAAVKVASVVALAGATVATTAADHMGSQHRAPTKAPAPVSKPVRQAVPTTPQPPNARPAITLGHAAVTQPRPRHPRHSPASPPRAEAPRPAHVRAATTPTADPAPAPVVTQEQAAPVAAVTPKVDPPTTPKAHTKPAKAAEPSRAAAVHQDKPAKGREKDPPADQQPAPEPAAPATEASGNSADHGREAAPGQQDKPEAANVGRANGK